MNHQKSTGKTAAVSLFPTLPLSNRAAGNGSLLLFWHRFPLSKKSGYLCSACWIYMDSGVYLLQSLDLIHFQKHKSYVSVEWTAWDEVSNTRTLLGKF